MATSATPTKTKYVFSASAVPDESVKAAQVVIVAEFSWHVIAPAPYRMHCLLSFAPVPKVACPVVDVRGVQDDEKMAEIIKACTDPSAGVINLDGLLTGLEAMGAKVAQKAESRTQKPTARGQQTAESLAYFVDKGQVTLMIENRQMEFSVVNSEKKEGE